MNSISTSLLLTYLSLSAAQNTGDILVRNTGEINTKIPKLCRTVDNQACVFPFIYKGKTYEKCTFDDTNDNKAWCATRVNEQTGEVYTNSYGNCEPSTCDIVGKQSSCTTVAGPRPNRPCIFPFKYQGKTYTGCTSAIIDQLWCSTKTTSNGDHIQGEYGLCSNNCKADNFKECKPGDSWKKDCNTCICKQGKAVCTEKVCPKACRVIQGPAAGKQCVFPFSFNGVTYNGCPTWSFGGSNQGKRWCSTKTVNGVHDNGNGHYGFCSNNCPNDEVIVKSPLRNRILETGEAPN